MARRSASVFVEDRYSAATPLLCRLSTWFCINAAASNRLDVRCQCECDCQSAPMTLSAKRKAVMDGRCSQIACHVPEQS